jgi:hypothetical protein
VDTLMFPSSDRTGGSVKVQHDIHGNSQPSLSSTGLLSRNKCNDVSR